MTTIKVGRETYEIQALDYIMFNGSAYMFCSGDGRVLRRKKHWSWDYVTLPKKAIKLIPFKELSHMNKTRGGTKLDYWYFQAKNLI